MNPNPGIGLKGFKQGYGISAKTLQAMGRALFHARGTNGNNVRWEGGTLVVEGSGVVDNDHPFKITASFDAPAAPTVCLVAIHPGTLQGTLATGSTYAGVPLFEGSGGAPLDDDPAPDFDVGVTARTNYFYFVVTTDEFGLVDTVWIEHFIAADLPLVETPYVQPDFPSPGDPGNAGVYYWLLGTVTISGTNPSKEIAITQGVETSLGFYTCGGQGRFYRA